MLNAIQNSLAAGELDSEELYNCLHCQSKTKAHIKMKPVKFPELLIIHIKRFEEYNH